jgi:uncharacterized protein YkwD
MDGSALSVRVTFLSLRLGRLLFLLLLEAAAVPSAHSDALSAVQVLRQGGCGGIVPLARPLQRRASLDRAAEQWASGSTLAAAAARNGYGQVPTGVHVRASDAAVLEVLRRSECRKVTDRSTRDIGIFRRGDETWLVLASEAASAPTRTWTSRESAPRAPQPVQPVPQPSASSPQLATRALALVNEARSRGTRCGGRVFAPAPPVRLSGTLAGVAFGHAADMAQHNYFEHEDLAGHTPADRVRAMGYKEKLVGENIAYGPASVEEAVQGWLNSPDHCENIMDPRFAEMGIASAAGRASRHGLYWVQVLADPRA